MDIRFVAVKFYLLYEPMQCEGSSIIEQYWREEWENQKK